MEWGVTNSPKFPTYNGTSNPILNVLRFIWAMRSLTSWKRKWCHDVKEFFYCSSWINLEMVCNLTLRLSLPLKIVQIYLLQTMPVTSPWKRKATTFSPSSKESKNWWKVIWSGSIVKKTWNYRLFELSCNQSLWKGVLRESSMFVKLKKWYEEL